MEGKAVPGQLVVSKSGRDSGRVYLVLNFDGDRFLRVADGAVRRVEKPKRKNVKHLRFFPAVAQEITEKLKSGERITNPEVRRAIGNLVDDHEKQ